MGLGEGGWGRGGGGGGGWRFCSPFSLLSLFLSLFRLPSRALSLSAVGVCLAPSACVGVRACVLTEPT